MDLCTKQEMAGEDGFIQQHPGEPGSSGTLQNTEEPRSSGAEKQDSVNAKEKETPKTEKTAWDWKQEILYLTLFVSKISTFMAFALIGPLFPPEAKSKGISYTVQGWIIGIFALTRVCTCSSYNLLHHRQ